MLLPFPIRFPPVQTIPPVESASGGGGKES